MTVMLLVMFQQQIVAEIAFEITPDRMDMIPILGIVEFDHKGWALDHVVVQFTRFCSAGPREMELFPTALFYLSQVPLCQLLPMTVSIFFHECYQELGLL